MKDKHQCQSCGRLFYSEKFSNYCELCKRKFGLVQTAEKEVDSINKVFGSRKETEKEFLKRISKDNNR